MNHKQVTLSFVNSGSYGKLVKKIKQITGIMSSIFSYLFNHE